MVYGQYSDKIVNNNMKQNVLCIIPLLSMFLVLGCSTNKDIYYWGVYERLIYDTYVNLGSIDTATQIEQLKADIKKTKSAGKKVIPGLYAQLGFLYAMEGKHSQSKAALKHEQILYPESSVFIEGLLNRHMQNTENQS